MVFLKRLTLVYLGIGLTAAGCATPPAKPPQIAESGGIYHEVQKGQTLWGIAASYGIKADELKRLNKLPDSSKLSIGQLLYIPGKKSSADPGKN